MNIAQDISYFRRYRFLDNFLRCKLSLLNIHKIIKGLNQHKIPAFEFEYFWKPDKVGRRVELINIASQRGASEKRNFAETIKQVSPIEYFSRARIEAKYI